MIFLILIIIQVAVFGALIFILKGILKRNFGTAASHLEALTQNTEARLAEAKKKVEEANAYYNDLVSKAKGEGDKQRQQLIEEGLKEKQDLLDRAKKESDAIMERARSARKLLEETWNQEVAKKACEVTFQILQTVLPGKVNQLLQAEWLREALVPGFEGLSHLNVPDSVDRVEVVSAVPLTDVQKRIIITKLKEKIGRLVEIEEKIDEKLIMGFRLSMGSVVIDSSLAWKLKEALQHDGTRKDS